MIVAGLGCKANAPVEAVLGAIAAALRHHAVEPATLDALATSEKKAAEPGIRGAAEALALPGVRPRSLGRRASVMRMSVERNAGGEDGWTCSFPSSAIHPL